MSSRAVAQGALRQPMYTVNKLWSCPFMIERTDHVGNLPRWFAQDVQKNFDIDIHASPVPVAEQHIYMTWHVRNNDDPGHKMAARGNAGGVSARGQAGLAAERVERHHLDDTRGIVGDAARRHRLLQRHRTRRARPGSAATGDRRDRGSASGRATRSVTPLARYSASRRAAASARRRRRDASAGRKARMSRPIKLLPTACVVIGEARSPRPCSHAAFPVAAIAVASPIAPRSAHRARSRDSRRNSTSRRQCDSHAASRKARAPRRVSAARVAFREIRKAQPVPVAAAPSAVRAPASFFSVSAPSPASAVLAEVRVRPGVVAERKSPASRHSFRTGADGAVGPRGAMPLTKP